MTDLARMLRFHPEVPATTLCRPDETPILAIVERDPVQIGFFTSGQHRTVSTPGQSELSIEGQDAAGLRASLR